MKKETEGLKYQSLLVEGFKNISHREVEINGQSFIISGKNAVGKSSLIQALISPLDSKYMPTTAIQNGQDKGKIEVVLAGTLGGKPKKYTVEVFFTPGKQSGRLVVSNEIGETIKSPSTFLKSLIGNISFDIMEFLNSKKEKRVQILKELTGCQVEIDLITVDILDKKAVRKANKERAESLEGSVAHHGYSQAQVELFSNKIDIAPLQEQMAGISKSVENYTKMEGKKKEFSDAIPAAKSDQEKSYKETERLDLEIKRLQGLQAVENQKRLDLSVEIEKCEKNLVTCNEWFAENPKPNVEAINEKIVAANTHNQHYEKLLNYSKQQKEVNQIKEEIGVIESDIKKLEEKRNNVISKSQLPIPGLTFTENEVFLDNLPLEEWQINSARLMDIGFDIAVAQKPNLRCIFLHDASLLDKEALDVIMKKAHDKNIQVIAEIVSEEENAEIHFVETDIK